MKVVSTYQSYDHRLKEIIIENKNPKLFPDINIPRTTIQGWMSKGIKNVVSPFEDKEVKTKLAKYQELENKCSSLETKLKLIKEMISVFGWKADWNRLPGFEEKQTLIQKIKEATKKIKLTECLELLGLSKSRYYYWLIKEKGCALDDYSSCPKTKPSQIRAKEVSKIKEMATLRSIHILQLAHYHFMQKKSELYLLLQQPGES